MDFLTLINRFIINTW